MYDVKIVYMPGGIILDNTIYMYALEQDTHGTAEILSIEDVFKQHEVDLVVEDMNDCVGLIKTGTANFTCEELGTELDLSAGNFTVTEQLVPADTGDTDVR